MRLARGLTGLLMLASVVLHNLAPFMGDTWHDFVPEHEHWYTGGSPLGDGHAHNHAHAGATAQLAPASDDVTQAPQESVVHTIDPGEAISALAVSLALDAGIALRAPDGPSRGAIYAAVASAPALLAPQKPPPRTA